MDGWRKLGIFLGMVLVVSLWASAKAYAMCSYPYIDDANECGKGKLELVVCAYGDKKPASYELRVTDMRTKKRVKATKVKRKASPAVWTVRVKKGRTYKFATREKGGKWNVMRYGID